MLLSQHGFISHSQDACGDDDTDADSDILALEYDDEFTDTDANIFALEDGAGTEVSNQHPVPDSATPGI